MLILTERMIRDKLSFSGPMSLGEIVAMLGKDTERTDVLVMLNSLQDKGQAVLDAEKGVWRSLVTLS